MNVALLNDYPVIETADYGRFSDYKGKKVMNCGNCRYEISDISRIESIKKQIRSGVKPDKVEDHYCKRGDDCMWKKRR
jgi:hypothetical protein